MTACLQALKLLSYNTPDADDLRDDLEVSLRRQVTRCDICVAAFYRSIWEFRDRLNR